MIIGTAGHIDHGKTSLVKALTGVDADRLKEEKARGITLDLGYAYVPAANGAVLGFVDVPGHERLVHNMLAGATGIDFVLLVIAADDGPMPQTREHLQILDLLGLNHGAVALTKIDAVSPERRARAAAEIESLLAGSALAGAPVFPVSNLTGEGIAALRAHLDRAADNTLPHAANGYFRLAVDRSFTLAGAGTVVTGTVHAGTVHVGDRLLVSPAGREVRVRGIHAQNRAADEGRAGQRCALNLAGVEKQDIERGDWVVAPELHAPSARLDAALRWLSADIRAKDGLPVHAHIGAADVMGRLTVLQQPGDPGGPMWVQIVLERPLAALRADRVIVRDQSAQHTLAGGVVLDPFAPARRHRAPARLAVLAALAAPEAPPALAQLLALSPAGVDRRAFALSWNLAGEAAELWSRVPMVVARTAAGELAFSPERWQAFKDQLLQALAAAHARAPELLGLTAAQLRRAAVPALPWPVFNVLLEELIGARLMARRGQWLHLPGHRISLTPHEHKLWERAAPMLAAQPFQPPRVRDIARALNAGEAQVRTLLQRQTMLGETYLVAHDHYFLREAFAQLLRIAAELAAGNERRRLRAAEFRDRIGTGRKLAIQILECFDRMGLSRRAGEVHYLHAHAMTQVEQAPAAAVAAAGRPAMINGRDSHPGGATGLQIR